MKRLYIIVEGQSEQEFVNQLIAPYLANHGIYSVTPLPIRTSKSSRGGFVNYQHLKNDVQNLLSSQKTDFLVTTFVDYFRIPTLPNKESYEHIIHHDQQIAAMEQCIAEDIKDRRFIPYIQMHEFEALLFSSNKGFSEYFGEKQSEKTAQIISLYSNPEDINTTPEGAPSKRILAIKPDYEKVIEGNSIALEIGIAQILNKCPRFKRWIETLVEKCKE